MKIRYKNSRMKGDYEAISKFIKYKKYYSLIFLRQPHRSEHERKKKIKKSSSCV